MTVQFKPQAIIDIESEPMAPPNWQPPPGPSFYSEEEHLSKLLNEIVKTPKQTDERGYFIQYYTTSTKKPYVWERYDAFVNVKPDEYGAYYTHAKSELEKTQVTYEWTGIKVVAFSFDSLNPMYGAKYLKEFCFEIVAVKKKTYINGANASQEFLAKKGKMFTTKAGV
jgi:hypothetical protein